MDSTVLSAEQLSDEAARFGDPLDLLTPDALCALLKVRRSWLYDAVESGVLPALRLGRQLRFRRLDVVRFVESRTSVRE
jgi:excisionase family DNA binding protein